MDEAVKPIDKLDVVLRVLRETKKEIEALEARQAVLRDQALLLMGERKEFRFEVAGRPVWASRVVATRRKYNPVVLERKLKAFPDLLNRVTERKVLPDEFERAVRTGEISPDVKAEVYSEYQTTPYIKFGEGAPSTDQFGG